MAYAARSDIEAVFGLANVAQWAALDSSYDAAAITARITSALAYAEEAVNDLLRGGVVTIPITATVPRTIVDATAKLAGMWLFESRGVREADPLTGEPLHRYSSLRREVESWLAKVRTGAVRTALTQNDVTYPSAGDDDA